MSGHDDMDSQYPMREQLRRARTSHDSTPPPPSYDATAKTPQKLKRHRFSWALGTVSFLITAFVIVFVAIVFFTLPDLKRALASSQTEALSITLLDINGDEIGIRGRRTMPTVPVTEMPSYLINAVLATEDRRFFDHNGFDPRGITRAMIRNIQALGFVEGGSTITQQVAKNLYLNNSRTIWRKSQEALITLWLESNLTKEEILTLYMNRIYMGAGNYGMDAAARYYFGKSVRDVSLAEAAILAGLPKAPSRYAPTNDIEEARGRANHVLDRLVIAGSLTEAEVEGARKNPAEVMPRRASEGKEYFTDFVADQVRALFPDLTGRVTVHTTLDARRQKAAEDSIETALENASKNRKVSQGALIALAPDGAIRAMVGGKSYVESQFNRAVQAKRQPGSAFKPVVYLAALEAGYKPTSLFTEEAISMDGWAPRNASTREWGTVSLATALTNSINTVTVQIGQKVGMDALFTSARRLGIESPMPRNLSIALGSAEVSLLELTSAYTSFGNEGRHSAPYAIRRIEAESGDVLYVHQPELQHAITPTQAHDMTYMLHQVIAGGTGRAAALNGRLAAGKTGTSQDHRDAWFIGYTGHEVAGVWFGNDDNTPTNGASGGNLAAPAWRHYMSIAEQGSSPAPLPGAIRHVVPSPAVVAATKTPQRSRGFFSELASLFSAAPEVKPRNDDRWGSGFRRGGETIKERSKR